MIVVSAAERGSVLLCTLMVITLIATLGAALSLVISTESVVAANYHTAQEGLYAAEAGIEYAIGEIRLSSAWNSVPSSVTSSSDFNDGQSISRGPDGSTLDLSRLTIKRQAESDAIYPNGPDRPVWRLYAHAPLNRMVPGAGSASPYVIMWIADDPDDLDGNPAVDTNDIVMLHGEAFAVRAGRRAIDATIRREQAMAAGLPGVMRTDVHVLSWHEVR